MAEQCIEGSGHLPLHNNYFDIPDITSRLSAHDDHPTNRERLVQYPDLRRYHSHEEANVKEYVWSGVSLISLVAENMLSHPFLVLRRQCQVHNNSARYHLLPITLIPTIYHLHQHQGLTTLWKGLGSVLLVRGMQLGVEDIILKLTYWPKEINVHSSLKQFFNHILLKCLTFVIVTPFYSASLVETVQSEIASEKPAILDVFREGFARLLNWGAPTKARMLPIWALIVPTATLGVTKYLFSKIAKATAVRFLQLTNNNKQKESHGGDVGNVNLFAYLLANFASDAIFYPCETIVHRLHLQGTRTIVDNLDNGRSVLPILTNYSGPVDCYRKCLAQEGRAGLYKGFGALVLQYTAHIALIRVSHFILNEILKLFKKSDPKIETTVDTSPPALCNITMSPRSYLLP
ncbi:mitochondrial outer membrane protein SLC25A46 isoform X2 [Cylas formicarius]|uniref:mitochondrial outer membrane protein SLC25A46 isoform X2 n=1 Tax=Cylas formicarius TaxID=197179 RepID=UPI0029585421|nr:mitochondrial outer membrane protein SLC25A46 isoform X2 [Cylas formicarius]